MTRHRGLWIAELANLGIFFGIVWNMTQKPATGEAIAAILIGYAVGAIVAMRLSRAPRAGSAQAVTKPAA
jgi:hypothetical protein